MEVIRLEKYKGTRLVVICPDGERHFLNNNNTKELLDKIVELKEEHKEIDIKPVKEVQVSEAMSDVASEFIDRVQSLIKLDVNDVTKFWDFMKGWSRIISKKTSKPIYMVSDEVKIVLD